MGSPPPHHTIAVCPSPSHRETLLSLSSSSLEEMGAAGERVMALSLFCPRDARPPPPPPFPASILPPPSSSFPPPPTQPQYCGDARAIRAHAVIVVDIRVKKTVVCTVCTRLNRFFAYRMGDAARGQCWATDRRHGPGLISRRINNYSKRLANKVYV